MAQGLVIITYYSLASGFLSGKYRSESDLTKSRLGKGIAIYLDARGLCVLEALDAAAAQVEAKPAEIALAWLTTSSPSIGCIKPFGCADVIVSTKCWLKQKLRGWGKCLIDLLAQPRWPEPPLAPCATCPQNSGRLNPKSAKHTPTWFAGRMSQSASAPFILVLFCLHVPYGTAVTSGVRTRRRSRCRSIGPLQRSRGASGARATSASSREEADGGRQNDCGAEQQECEGGA